MKLGQMITIIFMSILTFIGLLITKLYEKYVKQNIFVQGALYIFWTAIIFRILYWAVKPFINSTYIINTIKHVATVLNYFNIASTNPIWMVLCFIVCGISVVFLAKWTIKQVNNDNSNS